MTRRPTPGPPATPADFERAVRLRELRGTELTRIRAGAMAWRNGLAALLVGLVGFGLIKGRSDIGQLAQGWGIVVGVVLLVALFAGAVGAALLLRAAHGHFRVVAIEDLPTAETDDHIEAMASAMALNRGIVATTACAGLLIVAVAVTWYGPPREPPAVRLGYNDTIACGTVLRVTGQSLVLKTEDGELTVLMSALQTVKPVISCKQP